MVTISTLMSRESAEGVEAIMYLCGSLCSQHGKWVEYTVGLGLVGVGCMSGSVIVSSVNSELLSWLLLNIHQGEHNGC